MQADSTGIGAPAPRMARSINPALSFWALIRRELQQHRGALIYTPLVVGAILVIITLLGVISGESVNIRIGSDVSARNLLKFVGDPAMAPQRTLFFQAFSFGVLSCFHLVMFVVLVLYCLGSLFDERRDRSVLFFKSMPVSDTRTVLSKLATAALVTPMIMLIIFTVTYVLVLLLTSITVWRFGANPIDAVWGSNALFSQLWRAMVVEAVNALWLLPVFGWLIFCSSFSKVRPILWAAMVPFWIWVIGRWIDWSGFAEIRLHAVADWLANRAAAGVMPIGAGGSWNNIGLPWVGADVRALSMLSSAQMWIGIAVGAAFIAAAIYWRRYRDDSI